MSEPLKTITVIVDRRVLSDILQTVVQHKVEHARPWTEIDPISYLQQEVESGERCELYARDWLGFGEEK